MKCSKTLEPNTKVETKYLRFIKTRFTGKTFVWSVHEKNSGYRLGEISWHSPWRKYVFLVDEPAFFDSDCLADISNFLKEEMKKHREQIHGL